MTTPAMDSVNRPSHYVSLPAACQCGEPIECITVTEHLNFCLGNAVKYLWRADHKGAALVDLRKARWYIDREIQRREALAAKDTPAREDARSGPDAPGPVQTAPGGTGGAESVVERAARCSMPDRPRPHIARLMMCLLRGHLWDSERPAGALHERDFCWRCAKVRP